MRSIAVAKSVVALKIIVKFEDFVVQSLLTPSIASLHYIYIYALRRQFTRSAFESLPIVMVPIFSLRSLYQSKGPRWRRTHRRSYIVKPNLHWNILIYHNYYESRDTYPYEEPREKGTSKSRYPGISRDGIIWGTKLKPKPRELPHTPQSLRNYWDLHPAGNEASHIMALLHWVRIRNNPGYPRSQTASVCPGSHNHIKSKHPSADLWNIPAVDPRIYKSNRNLIHMKVAWASKQGDGMHSVSTSRYFGEICRVAIEFICRYGWWLDI
jgi:hypothetical protein